MIKTGNGYPQKVGRIRIMHHIELESHINFLFDIQKQGSYLGFLGFKKQKWILAKKQLKFFFEASWIAHRTEEKVE